MGASVAEHTVPTHLLRVLRYVETVARGGVHPTQHEIDAFAALIPPSGDAAPPWRLRSPVFGVVEREPVATYLIAVGWLSVDDYTCGLSDLGHALLEGLKDEDAPPDEVSAVILSPEDPMRYELLTREIGKAGAGLIVDPYLKPGHVDWLTTSTTVERVLVGATRSQMRDNALLPLALGRQAVAGRTPPEVRITQDPSLHDRVLVAEDGAVSLLGSSLTGISMHVTAIVPLPEEAASAYRQHVEALWRAATRVEPRDGIVTDIQEAPEPSAPSLGEDSATLDAS